MYIIYTPTIHPRDGHRSYTIEGWLTSMVLRCCNSPARHQHPCLGSFRRAQFPYFHLQAALLSQVRVYYGLHIRHLFRCNLRYSIPIKRRIPRSLDFSRFLGEIFKRDLDLCTILKSLKRKGFYPFLICMHIIVYNFYVSNY